jgi:hypothetical protein
MAYMTYREGDGGRWWAPWGSDKPAPRVKLLAPATAARRSAGA